MDLQNPQVLRKTAESVTLNCLLLAPIFGYQRQLTSPRPGTGRKGKIDGATYSNDNFRPLENVSPQKASIDRITLKRR